MGQCVLCRGFLLRWLIPILPVHFATCPDVCSSLTVPLAFATLPTGYLTLRSATDLHRNRCRVSHLTMILLLHMSQSSIISTSHFSNMQQLRP